ncbi:hypothetical protein BGZ95_007712 [Linnemannia exigua]|uniref:Uncharacterized protein n=1 Tax=Linnemannia exigua TaxID=604196 RepID=A0AAD4DF77_9FUNG|nr:hypothetical protein BGZ95_007712 [Linnemannia exigua]
MNPKSIMKRAIDLLEIINDLETEEQRYITLFRIPSRHRKGGYIFNGGSDFQNERHGLYAIRIQLYACSVALKIFLEDIEQLLPQKQSQHDIVTRAREMRRAMRLSMAMRRDELLLEKSAYKEQGHAINDGHAQLNSAMANDISDTF